jgi:hypothetical protein
MGICTYDVAGGVHGVLVGARRHTGSALHPRAEVLPRAWSHEDGADMPPAAESDPVGVTEDR